MKKILFLIPIILLASGCVQSSQEYNSQQLDKIKTQSEMAKMCHDSGTRFGYDGSGNPYCY